LGQHPFPRVPGARGRSHDSYAGRRRLPYQGATINVDQNVMRRTYVDAATAPKTTAFFGDSRLRGSGTGDERTILRPLPGYVRSAARNFGEAAHTAHQDLNALVQVLAKGLEPDVVGFCDGSSEINQCRVGLTAFSATDGPEIRSLLDLAASSRPGTATPVPIHERRLDCFVVALPP
jgi:hypothetical protein